MVGLDALYAQYRAGVLKRKKFEELLCGQLLTHVRRKNSPEFLSDLYPALRRAIDAYKDTGASFEAYVLSKLYWAAKGCRPRELSRSAAEGVFWKDRALEARERQGEYSEALPGETLEIGKNKPLSSPRQLLFLALKSYLYVSDEFISRMAPVIGIEPGRLADMIDTLRSMRLKQDTERQALTERIESQHYRCVLYAEQVKSAPAGSPSRERAESRLAKAEKRREAMRRRRAAMGANATNRQIAEVLGIPKGTVDSNLYALKQKFKALLQQQAR
ncbi:MAG: hypothetical protein LBD13_05750 [Spirochaetaceae bacterium]|jgi:DNA-binding CsgD family transcriptional regulator|nr:hypothetical protein [Spirochaetaceae bacterium]